MLGLPASCARTWWAESSRMGTIGRSVINATYLQNGSSMSAKVQASPGHSPACPHFTGPQGPANHHSFSCQLKPFGPCRPAKYVAPLPGHLEPVQRFAGSDSRGWKSGLRTFAEAPYQENSGEGKKYESKFYGKELVKQAARQNRPKTEYQKHKRGKKGKKTRAAPKNYRANKSAYKDLIYKWFLMAYPESLSRQEVSGRLNAHPKKVKGLIIKPLVTEGKLMKWGQRTAPFERYMPVIKAPEYYEVTGEEPPVMPDIDENEIFRNRVPGTSRRQQDAAKDAPVDPAAIPPGFQDSWEEGGKLDQEDVQKLQEISSLQGWDELFQDPSDEEETDEEEEEDEATLLARMKASRLQEQRRVRGEDVDTDEDEDSDGDFEDDDEEQDEDEDDDDDYDGNSNTSSGSTSGSNTMSPAATSSAASSELARDSFTDLNFSSATTTAASSAVANIDFGAVFDDLDPFTPRPSTSRQAESSAEPTSTDGSDGSRSPPSSRLSGDSALLLDGESDQGEDASSRISSQGVGSPNSDGTTSDSEEYDRVRDKSPPTTSESDGSIASQSNPSSAGRSEGESYESGTGDDDDDDGEFLPEDGGDLELRRPTPWRNPRIHR